MPLLLRSERLPLAVLALGVATMLSAVAAMVFLATYEGVGLIGYRTAAAAAASVVCAALTVAGFIVTSTGIASRSGHRSGSPARSVPCRSRWWSASSWCSSG